MKLGNISIFNSDLTKNKLNWYIRVADNLAPAKFLIARSIKCDFKLNMKIDLLWSIFDESMLTLNNIRKNIDEFDYKSVTPNLLDLCVEISKRILSNCNFCHWNCGVDRMSGEMGVCKLDSDSRVSSFFHHNGEELVFRGKNGSGTIFFTSCNMRCVFCQNGDISTDSRNGDVIGADQLASIIKLLRFEGVHNINFVGGDPIVHLHTIIDGISRLNNTDLSNTEIEEIINLKADYFINYSLNYDCNYISEFNVPMLWNSNFYMSADAFRLLSVLMDVWLPDLKFYDEKCSRRLAKVSKYFEVVSSFLIKLYEIQENFVIRHLILPEHIDCCTIPILEWINEYIPDTLVNIMTQFHPDMRTDPKNILYNEKYADLCRKLSKDEINRVFEIADQLNINYKDLII